MASAVVVFESLFGDAEKIARAIATGLSEHLDVEVFPASDAPLSFGPDLRLLVVGGPNHPLSNCHEWLDRAQPLHGISAAAFDTRMDRPRMVTALDHAARTEVKLLHKLGATLAAPAEHFHVVNPKGSLADGEEDRARHWGAALSEIVTAGSRR